MINDTQTTSKAFVLLMAMAAAFVLVLSYNSNINDPSPSLGTRRLGSLSRDMGDPKTVELVSHQYGDGALLKKLKILVLGGSITWGGSLDDREKEAYPFILKNAGHNVVNLAIRGAGSSYPSTCISSMLSANKYYEDGDNFDVILLEFSINGHEGFPMLLHRLKERYPDALFIYIDLYSYNLNQFDTTAHAIELTERIDGVIWQFSKKNTWEDSDLLNLYAGDRHHLNAKGHEIILKGVSEVIIAHGTNSEPRLGSWLGGDKCNSWYMTGEADLGYDDEAQMVNFDKKNHKYALEIGDNGAVLEYNHEGDKDAHLSIGYMTKCNDLENDGKRSTIYPPVVIKIEQSKEMLEEARKEFDSGDFHIERVQYDHLVSISDGWAFIGAVHRKRPGFHITQEDFAGVVKPGVNYVLIKPLSKTDQHFRIISHVTCEACKQLGFDLRQGHDGCAGMCGAGE